jgi:hypothetical protein
MQHDLCWSVDPNIRQKQVPRLLLTYIALSWSWASWSGPVEFHNVPNWEIAILDVKYSLATENPFGSVKSASLILRARLVETQVHISTTQDGRDVELKLAPLSQIHSWVSKLRCHSDCIISTYDHTSSDDAIILTVKRSFEFNDQLTPEARSVFLLPVQRSPSVFLIIVAPSPTDPGSFERIGVAVLDGSVESDVWFESEICREIKLV